MEATGESTTSFLLDTIKPPRLEDAGLEDCALPPESIKEAFLKAASTVRSAISASDDEEDSCDALVGSAPAGGCAVEKGGGETAVDDVAVVGMAEDGEACVDGLRGLEIGGKGRGILGKAEGDKKGDVADGGEGGDEEEKPILVEGYF